jgi:hypothetical protein
MNKKLKLSAVAVAMLMLSLVAVSAAMASPSTTMATPTQVSTAVANVGVAATPIFNAPVKIVSTMSATDAKATAENSLAISDAQVQNPELLIELVPKTLEEAENCILPIRTRYLMYTNDGLHIMWGAFRKGYFTGTDNLGKTCWGIYGRGVFAGFYDGQFFWGRYGNGAWKASYLFGLPLSYGRYVLFPPLAVAVPSPMPYPATSYPTAITP